MEKASDLLRQHGKLKMAEEERTPHMDYQQRMDILEKQQREMLKRLEELERQTEPIKITRLEIMILVICKNYLCKPTTDLRGSSRHKPIVARNLIYLSAASKN